MTGIRLLLPLLLLLPACCPDALYELTTAAPQVRLPADEAPHCFGGGEWWYYTGELHTDDGRGFGVETVIFHVPRLPFLASIGDVWFAHYSVLDETTGEFVYDQTRGRGHLAGSCGVPAGGGFELCTPLIRMTGSAAADTAKFEDAPGAARDADVGVASDADSAGDIDINTTVDNPGTAPDIDHITAAMSAGRFALDLALVDLRGPVLHDGSGYVAYGPRGRSFYYSRPRIAVAGTLAVDSAAPAVSGHGAASAVSGRGATSAASGAAAPSSDNLAQPQHVTGELWFDRQWGLALVDPTVRWDWFSVRLADGASIMLFHFRDPRTPVFFGTWIPAVGAPLSLGPEDFSITATAQWTSPHTGATYGTAWTLHLVVPSAGALSGDTGPSDAGPIGTAAAPLVLDLEIAAVADDQELDARTSTFNIYWEGLCRVTDLHGDPGLDGLAYVEQVADPR